MNELIFLQISGVQRVLTRGEAPEKIDPPPPPPKPISRGGITENKSVSVSISLDVHPPTQKSSKCSYIVKLHHPLKR